MNHRTSSLTLGAALLAALALWQPVQAQLMPSPALRVGAGFSEYDLAGTGTTGSAVVALDYPFAGFLVATASADYFSYTPEFSDANRFLFPEIGLQATLPGYIVSPYVGVGAGYALRLSGSLESDPTLHAAVGSRFGLNRGLGIWMEGRVRAVDPFVGTTAEIKAGLFKSL